jgi:hypothetical protein
MTNNGKKYEELAQHVFQQIVNLKPQLTSEGVKTIEVQRNRVIAGRGSTHQIDVLWEFEFGGVNYLTIIEAKDWATPVPQEKLFAFKAVLDDIPGQPRGIFVSRSGFQSGALEYAKHHGIKAYELREPKDSDWDGYIKIIHIEMNIGVPHYSDLRFEFDDEWLKAERQRLNLPVGTSIRFNISTGQSLLNEHGESIVVLQRFLDSLSPKGHREKQPIQVNHVFDKPVYIETGLEDIPKAKLKSLYFAFSMSVIKQPMTIDFGDVVGIILRDVVGGTEHVFDKALQLRNPNGANESN